MKLLAYVIGVIILAYGAVLGIGLFVAILNDSWIVWTYLILIPWGAWYTARVLFWLEEHS